MIATEEPGESETETVPHRSTDPVSSPPWLSVIDNNAGLALATGADVSIRRLDKAIEGH